MINFEKGWHWALSIVILYALFRFVESIYVYNVLLPSNPVDPHSSSNIIATSFSIYRDFVTVVTGLLTLIIGATGIGAYLSFKKFREEKDKIIAQLEDEMGEVVKRRKRLDMFLRIEEAKNSCDPEWGYLSAIKLYDRAESEYDESDSSESKDDERYLLYVLRGDAYYLAWKSCKSDQGRKNFFLQEAENNYNLALGENNKSMLALYGLGLVKFQSAIKDKKDVEKGGFDWNEINDFEQSSCAESQTDGEHGCVPIKLKPSLDYAEAKAEVVEEAVLLMEKAKFNGFDSTKISYEMGAMYEALNKVDFALKKYAEAYAGNYLAAGYQYCYLWMREKDGASDTSVNRLSKDDVAEMVEILSNVGASDANYSKAAYALLWYLYRAIPGFNNNKAVEAFSRTDRYTLSNLFKMCKAPHQSCSPSTA